ncbi:MAG: hypothetical protein H7645_03410 [Candidatus Heimdallarchaeota archaeon]|nr:hypothetical protein [Candidatus Heimdallarchaeota archaeon]MCK4769362.1 hypothetical protein [Candidatus Heimdallarchaeota archaeon]
MPDDVFILDKSGIPYYSRCFGGETCKMRPDHTLQTGFLAALYAFSKESYGQQEIRTVIFSDLKLHFKVNQEKDVIIVFTAPLSEKDEEVEGQMDMTLGAFLELYEQDIGKGYADTEKFDGFDQTLQELNVVKTKPMGRINLREKVSSWKKIFRRYKHK